jgi:hypothetical protein
MNILPVKGGLALAYIASILVALLMAAASVASLLAQTDIYPASQRAGNVGTDALNLIVGLPILLGSMWLAKHGSLIGLLCWPGALLYVLYIYTFYLIGVPLNALFLVYLTLVVLSTYTLIGIVANIDGDVVWQRYSARVPARILGVILVVVAFLFVGRTVLAVMDALTNHSAVDSMEFASWISDGVVQCPAMIACGVLLWQHKTLGYAACPGLLLELGILFAGLPMSLVAGALLTGSAVDASSAVLLPFGAIFFVLLAIFVRGAPPSRAPSALGG